jgi:uridine phosphorylase
MPFPQLRGKHRAKALFSPEDFQKYAWRGAERPHAPKNVVVLFGRRWGKYLDRRFPGTFLAATQTYRAGRSTGVTLLSGPGAPWAAIVVEELAALGARRFVLVGLAGSLQPDLRVGSFVVCRRALRDEGTSHHYYASGEFAPATPGLRRRLERTLERAEVPFTVGDS